MYLRSELDEDLRCEITVITCFMELVAVLIGSEPFRETDLSSELGFQILVKVLEAGRLTRVTESFTGGHIFRVDDHWEQGVDLLLELRDGRGEFSNEGVVEEYEVGEKVMTNKNTAGSVCQGLDESC